MWFYSRVTGFIGLAIGLLLSLTACADTPTGQALERSLKADPLLQGKVPPSDDKSKDGAEKLATLPADFPIEIPRYPDAVLKTVELPDLDEAETETRTRWLSAAAIASVRQFYQRQFQSGWEVLSRSSDHRGSTFVVRRKTLILRVSLRPLANKPDPSAQKPDATATAATELLIFYSRDSENKNIGATPGAATPKATDSAANDSLSNTENSESGSAKPDKEDARTDTTTDGNHSAFSNGATAFSDLNQVPPELREFVADVAKLGLLTAGTQGTKDQQTGDKQALEPNKPITRREYARWLVAANNRLYDTQPAKQIRLGVKTANPAFQDVAGSDVDFSAIQGLAEAGIIASPLSGESTAVLFRPDAPLTREQLILWKVPLDLRQALPRATLEAVQQTWGFQDAARINPKAMQAVLADFQNGDRANIRRVFGYTTLFQPQKLVTQAEAAAAIWYFGTEGEGRSAREVLQ